MQTGVFRLALSCVLAVVFAGVVARDALARIVVTENVSYYSIKGLNGTDLGRSMLRGGARTINLRHAIAATVTSFDFTDPKLAIEHGRCVVKNVTVHLKITYQFPKWSGRRHASGKLRHNWDAFYAALVRHEHTHGQIAKKFAKKIEREMLNLSGTVVFGCRDFGAFSKMRFSALSRQLKQLQLAFDRREDRPTSHISRLQAALLRSR
jgi:predicted secreted Zn-dependent protease